MKEKTKRKECRITGKRLPSKNALKKKVVKLFSDLRLLQDQWLQHGDDLKPLDVSIFKGVTE